MGFLALFKGLTETPRPVVYMAGSVPSAIRLNQAFGLDRAGRTKEAESIYWAMIQADSCELGAAINLADIWIRQGRFKDAEIVMEVMTDKFPLASAAWCNLSSARSEMGDHPRALDAANNAVKVDPSNGMAYYNRAECWWASGQATMAIRDYERAVTCDPLNGEIAEKLELARLAIQDTTVKQPFGNVKHELRQHGAWIVDGIEVASTMQCPHCDGHFVSMRDSGIERGWCSGCGAVTCGKPECAPCVPFLRKMEAIERGAALTL